jgi:hypothetical protein
VPKANGKHDPAKPFDLAGVKYRVVERRMMPPREILDSPAQWREHSQAQAQALLGVLQSIGITDSIKAWYSERAGGKLVTWDGHLRKSLDPDHEWPVDITDLTDEEADYALLTHDPLGAMAGTDKAALDALLAAVNVENKAVEAMLTDLAQGAGLYIDNANDDATAGELVDKAAELQAKWQVKTGDLWGMKPFTICPKCGRRHAL